MSGAEASAETRANPGKQVSQSAVPAPSGVGTSATSSTARQPLASASIPVLPTRPLMLTSLAALGASAGTTSSWDRSCSGVRWEVESHWAPL